ncbi:MAG: PBP1A family penicillin-binding protein [Acidobacteria bacterium]|nr:PBP1A family penicillin-binding protein [Acidobacteriota bacterium]MBS1866125.1 PBP1A family penicillin-binding protein [Acidobacteriota bacterium]
MLSLPPITLRLRGWKLIDRVALAFLLFCAILLGAAAGLLFVYTSDLPEIRALETYRPNVVTEVYADDGQLVGSFALQRRILMTYEQCPKVLFNAVTSIEDQHFEEHWGIDFPRIAGAMVRNIIHRRITAGASTITMQLAGNLFLDRSDRTFRRKIQEMLLALQIERHYTKPQIFTMYANQVYLAHGNYGFAAASQFYFGKSVTDLNLQEAALLAGMVNGPKFSPIANPEAALNRRNLVLRRMEEEGKLSAAEADAARKTPLGLHLQYPRNDLAPYFFEDIRKYLESTYGTEAVHERGLRVYTTLNVKMQRAANQAIRDGLHAYDRRHGWRGGLPNLIKDNLGKLDTYEDDDWRHAIEKGSYVTGLVMAADDKSATIKIGQYRALLSSQDIAWTGRKKPSEILKVGDLAQFSIQELRDATARVQLEQQPTPQAAMICIDNPTGEIKAMVGGYSFEDSKFNRATQAVRQVGSSFKVYVYADALEKGFTPFDTILDAPFTTISGGQPYSPRNYDEKFEGNITLRRALAGSRNVPAVKLAEKVGINTVVDEARRFGITTPLPPYLPLALGAADMKLVEHVSAFTVFPDDGIRIDPHMIRRVATYDGALLEEAHPAIHEVISPDVARTMTAMLEEVIQFGTGIEAKVLKRPAAGKTGTTQDYTDAWFVGFTPQITAGVWVGFDDKQNSLGKKETGARAALPIWTQFMQNALAGTPPLDFANVVPLEQQASEHNIHVDTPDTAPTEDEPAAPKQKPPAAPPTANATAGSTASGPQF